MYAHTLVIGKTELSSGQCGVTFYNGIYIVLVVIMCLWFGNVSHFHFQFRENEFSFVDGAVRGGTKLFKMKASTRRPSDQDT